MTGGIAAFSHAPAASGNRDCHGRRTRTPLAPGGRSDIVSPTRTEATIEADGIGKHSGVPLVHALKRIKAHGAQVGLGRCERAVNDALRLPDRAKREVAARALVLVDEVRTSAAALAAGTRAHQRGRAAPRRAGVCLGCGAAARSHIGTMLTVAAIVSWI
jgi:hypothetical protein